MSGRHQPEHGADSAEALAGTPWADLDLASRQPGPTMTITKAQYAALRDRIPTCEACDLPAKPGDTYCAGHARLMDYTDHERSGGIAANE